MRNFTEKLQQLSETQKKIIFFTVMAVVVVLMLFLEVTLTKKNITKISKSLQSINLPSIEIPKNEGINQVQDFLNSPDNQKAIEDAFKSTDGNEDIETADWKTYTNEKYGFEIQYPNDWQIATSGKEEWGAYSLFSFATDKEKMNSSSIGYIRVTVEDSNFVLGTRDWKNFELGAIKGSISCDPGICEIVFLSISNQHFYIQTKYNPDTDDLTQQMLSTFKFTPVK